MLLFRKGNIEYLVQERASLSSVLAPSLPSRNSKHRQGWQQSGLSSMHWPYDNNPMRAIQFIACILQMRKLKYKVSYLLKVT